MKRLFALFFAMALFFATKAQTKPDDELFGEWRFIQSDKAMQYRFRKVKQEGDVLYLKMQFRLNKNDEIFCKEPDCEGYLWFFKYKNELVDIDNHYMVYNTFDRTENLPQTIIIKLSKSEYGEQYWDDAEKSLFYKDFSSNESNKVNIGWACVDNILKGDKSNRCEEFDINKAEIFK